MLLVQWKEDQNPARLHATDQLSLCADDLTLIVPTFALTTVVGSHSILAD